MESKLSSVIHTIKPKCMCRCGCLISFDNYFRFIIPQKDSVLHFQSQFFQINVENSVASINLTQVFLNEFEEPVEAVY